MCLRNARLKALPGDVLFSRRRNIFWYQRIDAIGFAADVMVDPFQLPLDGFGRVYRRPNTPNPPARLTAATTSRQWLKATSGNSIPSISQIGDLIGFIPSRQTAWLVFDLTALLRRYRIMSPGAKPRSFPRATEYAMTRSVANIETAVTCQSFPITHTGQHGSLTAMRARLPP